MLEKRYKSLDYLRGLMAFSIMIFHYYGTLYGKPTSNELLGRLGIYGVSVFYVLSGLALTIAYKNAENLNRYFLLGFWLKRIFRLFPLLWVTIIATLLLTEKSPSQWKLFLNFTGLFGFIAPGSYIAKGQWSIGNELVFYALFPFLFILSKKYFKVFLISAFFTFLIGCYFAFYRLQTDGSLHQYWKPYIHPFNQLMFFTAGMVIGLLYEKGYFKKIRKIAPWGLFICILLFMYFPVQNEDKIFLVTGYARIVFFIITIFLCLFVFLSYFNLPSIIDVTLSKLGEASYSVYLLHPLVLIIVLKLTGLIIQLPAILLLLLSTGVSLVASYYMYIFFETKFIGYGKMFVKKFKLQ